MTGFFHTIVPGRPGRPVGGCGFIKNTTYIQNNFYGCGGSIWGNNIGYGANYGMNYNMGFCGNYNNKFMNIMMGFGLFSSLLGTITNLFGGNKKSTAPLNNNSDNNNCGNAVKINPNSSKALDKSNPKSEGQDGVNTETTVDPNGQGGDKTKSAAEPDGQGGGNSETTAEPDGHGGGNSETTAEPENQGIHAANSTTENSENDDNNKEPVFGANEVPQNIKTYPHKISRGDTWYHIVEGYYSSGTSKLSHQEILAIVKELRAQYVDGGHIENGTVLDSQNKEVDVSRMDLPRGEVKLPETITINGKEYTCNGQGTVKKVSYNSNGKVIKAGNYNERHVASKWQPTVNGKGFGENLYDSKDDAVNFAKKNYEE